MDNLTPQQKEQYLKDLYKRYPELNKNATQFAKAVQKQAANSAAKKGPSELKEVKKLKDYTALKATTTPEQKEKQIQYAEQVRNFPRRIEYINKPMDYNLFPYLQAKKIVWNCMKESLQQQGREFIIDGNLKEILGELTKYFIRDKSCKFDLNKGINLFGFVGVGKSWIMQIFSTFTNMLELQTAFQVKKMRSITQEIRNNKKIEFQTVLNGVNCFDDVGFEPLQIRIFGDTESVFTTIIDENYERFKKSGKLCHITTNLLPEVEQAQQQTILSTYGVRVADRCKEMFNLIYLGGNSKRGQNEGQQ